MAPGGTALRGVAPSILAADFARLGAQVGEVLVAGAAVIHVDVMDGHFVPPLTMGPMVVDALAPAVHEAGAVLDVHLMVERPERQVDAFASAGADSITIHAEATPNVHFALGQIREKGLRCGLALNPGTPVEALGEVAGELDLALCMTVNPGWGGQPFIERSLDRIPRMRALIGEGPAIEVDGGIGVETAGRCAGAGATLFVAGTAIFGAPDPAAAFAEIAAAVS